MIYAVAVRLNRLPAEIFSMPWSEFTHLVAYFKLQDTKE